MCARVCDERRDSKQDQAAQAKHTYLDVNSASGKVRVRKKGEIEFDNEISMTQVCCDSEYAENLMRQLTGMTEYKIENDELVFSGNGQIRLKRK